jgi:hypothetical protein
MHYRAELGSDVAASEAQFAFNAIRFAEPSGEDGNASRFIGSHESGALALETGGRSDLCSLRD